MEKEKAISLHMMQDPLTWPLYPVLPLKNRKEQDSTFSAMPATGCLIVEGDSVQPVVYMASCYQLSYKLQHGIPFPEIRRRDFSSFQEIIDAGWVVD